MSIQDFDIFERFILRRERFTSAPYNVRADLPLRGRMPPRPYDLEDSSYEDVRAHVQRLFDRRKVLSILSEEKCGV